MTRRTAFSHIHPYPAMIADELALSLVAELVHPGDVVLDPFCGSGRTLAAASCTGAISVGIDVNPLAILITRAKFARVDESEIRSMHTVASTARALLRRPRAISDACHWLKEHSAGELGAIIDAINVRRWSMSALRVVACLLSATVREVSLTRASTWKMHRVPQPDRVEVASAIDVFARRVCSYARERDARRGGNPNERMCGRVAQGDARLAAAYRRLSLTAESVDVIITSPPYGDSRTTVSYGGMSSLCLSYIARLRGLEALGRTPAAIDSACLGGRAIDAETVARKYWLGADVNEARPRVERFMSEFGSSLRRALSCLRPGGRVGIVVARRMAGGRRLRLDDFAVDVCAESGVDVVEVRERRIGCKVLHRRVVPKARSGGRGVVATMRSEYVLIARRSRS